MLEEQEGLIGNIVECKDTAGGGRPGDLDRLIGNIVECKGIQVIWISRRQNVINRKHSGM